MANEIDLIVGSEAFAQITKLLTELGKVDKELTTLSSSFSNLGKGATNPADAAALKALTENNAKLNAEILKLSNSYDDLNKKISEGSNEIVKRSKYTTQEITDLRLVNKELTLQNTKASELAGAYEKLSAAHKIARQSAADLGAIQGTNSKAFLEAAASANTYDKKLKEIDQQLGNHGRHVGDYSRSWNGLGNSINQLTREAPAFANSLQTGFMALSNNIPILADEINNLTLRNKELQATGKPTESIFKQVAGAFFSWQTLLSLGVTILTVYGAQIWEMITAGDEAAESQKKLNEEISNVNNTITPQIVQLQSLVDIVNSSTESEKNRQLAYEEIKKTLPGLTSATYTQAIATGELKTATDLYISSLIQQQVVEAEAKSIAEEQTKLNQETSKSTKERMSWLGRLGLAMSSNEKGTLEAIKKIKDAEDKSVQDGINLRKKDLISRQEDFLKTQKLLKPFVTDPSKANKTAEKNKEKLAEEAAKKEEERLKREYNALLSNLQRQKEIDKDGLESFKGSIEDKTKLSIQLAQDEINIANVVFQEKKRLAKGDVDLITVANNEKLTAEENAQQENIKRTTKYYEDLNKATAEYYKNNPPLFVESPEAKKAREKEQADIKKSLEEQATYLKGFVDDFASQSGFPETFKMLSGEIEGFGKNFAVTFNAISESAQEAFNMINQASQAEFDAEYERLDAQKEIALKNAGDNAVEKEKIEAEFAKKKKAIDKKKFESDKKMSMINIVIDTAQAVVATLAKGGGFFASPLALIVAAMGAAQLAMVATKQFPAYAEGTDNHSGGLMLVNDGAGNNFQEKVILPSGKVIRPQGRNVLMDAPKGTKVLNHEQQLFEMLQSNNISMSNPQYQGMTPDEMDEILGKHFGNIKTQNTIFDKNGFQTYVKNGNSITRSNSNRSQAIGISV